jgi:alpha-glucosidase
MVREDGVGRGLQPLSFFTNRLFGPYASGDSTSSYKPVPYFISSRMVSLVLENECYSYFDFTRQDAIEIKVASRNVSGRIINGEDPKQLLQEYTSFCGRMKGLPDFALDGVILGIQGGQEIVQEIVTKAKDAGVAITALWLQDWCGKRNQVVLGRVLKRLWYI